MMQLESYPFFYCAKSDNDFCTLIPICGAQNIYHFGYILGDFIYKLI